MKNIIIAAYFAIVLAIGLASGYFLGVNFSKGGSETVCAYGSGNLQQVRDRLLKANVITDYANALSGTVVSTSGNNISFEASLVNPLQDEKLKNRVATISENTKIYVYTNRSREEIDKDIEMNAANINELKTKLNTATESIKECMSNKDPKDCVKEQEEESSLREQINKLSDIYLPYSKREGSISDIKPGMLITVSAGREEKDGFPAQGINIAEKLEFEAVSIELRENLAKKDALTVKP